MNSRSIALLATVLVCWSPTSSLADWRDTEFERILPTAYVPGRPITVTLRAYAQESFSFYAELYEVLPPGWTPVSAYPAITSFDPDTRTIFWDIEIPGGIPLWFVAVNYDAIPPIGEDGEVSFGGYALYRYHDWEDPRFAVTTGDASLSRGAETVRSVPEAYPTIQEAVDASEFGDTVVVHPGLYPEYIEMRQGVDIRAEGHAPPEIRATQTAITSASQCCLHGLVISSLYKGILCLQPAFEVRDCVITSTAQCAIQAEAARRDIRIVNCTVAGNRGDGLCLGKPDFNNVVVNSVIFNNGGLDVAGGETRFSCLEDQIYNGVGENNLHANPHFADPSAGDYTLLPRSPCIDAGDNSVVGANEVDLAGNPRIMFGGKEIRVDMGAYEYQARTPAVSPLSNDLRLIWSSDPGKTYSVLYSFDLTTWHLADDNVPSAGGTTLWLDPIGWPPPIPTRFYRITENQ